MFAVFLFNFFFLYFFFFFFQAEDGIRDHCVTGVQTCALPISFQTGSCNSWDARPGGIASSTCTRWRSGSASETVYRTALWPEIKEHEAVMKTSRNFEIRKLTAPISLRIRRSPAKTLAAPEVFRR